MIVAFIAFMMGILVDFFRIDECAIDEYDWITIDVYEIKHDFISISTKHCRMSQNYWFRGSFVDLDIGQHDTRIQVKSQSSSLTKVE